MTGGPGMDDDSLLALAKSRSEAGDHPGAARALQQMADEMQSAGNSAGAALTLEFVSREWWSATEMEAAHRALVERLSLLRVLEDWHGVAATLVGLAFFPLHDNAKLAYWNEAKRLVHEHSFPDVENDLRAREDVARLTGRSIEDVL